MDIFDHKTITQRSKSLNDLGPVALTRILAKSMVKIVSKHHTSCIKEQFSCRTNKGTEDATLTMVNVLSSRLQQNNTYARILFIDFNSAFNAMQIHILLERLLDLRRRQRGSYTSGQGLFNRPPTESVRGTLSDESVLNAGAPQGCVQSPLLFSVHTNEMKL